jgi:beta-glucosidase
MGQSSFEWNHRAGWLDFAPVEIPLLRPCSLARLLGTVVLAATSAGAALAGTDARPVVHLNDWPSAKPALAVAPQLETKIGKLLAAMTLEEKVGQVIQADISTVHPDDLIQYPLGSILAGGDAGPGGNDLAPPSDWLKLADAFYAAVQSRPGSRVPLLWGIDAVHGHNNIPGATLFPHNIGLGAAHDPDLVRRIGAATAEEMRVAGQDWTFAPCIAVARDTHWGRTYESYSEDPALVATYAAAMVEGLQGVPNTADFLSPAHVLATAKHFLGDGGTTNGVDEGDTIATETELRDVHARAYYAAIGAGVQTVMASYSSWQGERMHGNAELLTGVLRQRMGFDGFVIGDWNGHAQVPGCRPDDCPAAFKAGIDMFMAPDHWRGLFTNTLDEVKRGVIPRGRLDDAVRNILRVKLRAGLFDAASPSARPGGGQFVKLASPEHRALAREAVRKSLVLLKNDHGILPFSGHIHLLVAGDSADSIPRQTGGWSISWQGTGTNNSEFPQAQSIFAGIHEASARAGGSAVLSVDGSYVNPPDIAIVVFGEPPYAEMKGDRPSEQFGPSLACVPPVFQRCPCSYLAGRSTPTPNWRSPMRLSLPGCQGARAVV